ncbi:MAG: hypothetical protein Q9193_002561 [Seirophora villosa]
MDTSSTSARGVNPAVMLEDPSVVDYELTDEIDASEYQVTWTNIMAEGRYRSPSVYEKVEVLMLCWEEHSRDFDTTKEVRDLKAVFENGFGYKVTTKLLDANRDTRLQIEVNAIVANFVRDHDNDGSNTLLIVYYAGHGKPGEFFGHLKLFGQVKPHAEKTTAVPGPMSFTSALIFALEALREQKPEGRFATDELLRKIKDAPNFPKDQYPELSDRDNNSSSAGRIILHPLRTDRGDDDKSYETSPSELADGRIVTLHFDFGGKPLVSNLETLGRKFNEIFERNTLGVHRVRWGGERPSVFARATRRFAASRKRKAIGTKRAPAHMKHMPSSMSCCNKKLDKGLPSPQTSVLDTQDSLDTESSSPLLSSSAPNSDRERAS